MRFDFSDAALRNRAFSKTPMTFIDQEPRDSLAQIIDLIAIETGNRVARDYWEEQQLKNLLSFASQRSAFWRARIGSSIPSRIDLSRLPILSRTDLLMQVDTEGPLLRPLDGIPTKQHSTSGSSGKPTHFFVSDMCARYNDLRSDAQFLIEGRDISLNNTRLSPAKNPNKPGFKVGKNAAKGPLATFFQYGSRKYIQYFQPDMRSLSQELARDPIGYLIAQPHLIETMFQHVNPSFFSEAETAMFIPLGGAVTPFLRDLFTSRDIPVRGTYSSEEIGPIGFECEKFPATYHVATSNVIVEVVSEKSTELKDTKAGRLLVTHLHSYATPFIRYDIGDLASLESSCPCGHDGPALSNVYGRSKMLLKHADGRVSIFYPRGRELAAITRFDEYRIRQTDIQTIVLEIGGRESLTTVEITALIELIKHHAGDDFNISVRAVPQIAWGENIKRLGFHNEIL